MENKVAKIEVKVDDKELDRLLEKTDLLRDRLVEVNSLMHELTSGKPLSININL